MKRVFNEPEELETYWQLPPNEICVNQRKVFTSKIPPKESNAKIGIIMEKDIVGEVEILKNLKKRQFTLKCYSHEGQLIRIPKQIFQDNLISDDQDKQYLLDRVQKIQVMEDKLMSRSKNGTLFNHFFSFENAYKQNRVQSKSNVFDDLQSPQTANSLRRPNIIQSTQALSARKASLINESVSSPINSPPYFLSKKNSIPTPVTKYPSSQNTHIILKSVMEQNFKDNRQSTHIIDTNLQDQQGSIAMKEEDQRIASQTIQKKLSLSNIKIPTLSYIQNQNTDLSLHPTSSYFQQLSSSQKKKRNLNLKLKLKTEQCLDKREEEMRIVLEKNKSQNQLNEQNCFTEDRISTLNDYESSLSPDKINTYYQKSKYQNDNLIHLEQRNDESSRIKQSNSVSNNKYKTSTGISQQYSNRSITQNPEYYAFTSPFSHQASYNPDNLQVPHEQYTSNSQRSFPQNIQRQSKKSMTSFDNLQHLQDDYQKQSEQIEKKIPQSSDKFERQMKKNQTFSGGHVDPFVKMFHKRLQYNFFQQYGKVDLQNLKEHVKIDALKQLPDVDSSIPSLTDIRVLIDEYLSYKNKQDIKKINQKYIKQASNIKQISQSQQHMPLPSQFSQYSIKKLQESNIQQDQNTNSQRQIQLQQSYQNHKQQQNGNERLSEIIVSDRSHQIQNTQQSEVQLTQKPIQKSYSQFFKNEYTPQSSDHQNNKQIADQIKNHSHTTQDFSQNQYSSLQTNVKNYSNPINFSQKQMASIPKISQNLHQKLEYLKQITNDSKSIKNSNKQYIQLGQTSSIQIKSLTKLPQKNELSKTQNFLKKQHGSSAVLLQDINEHEKKLIASDNKFQLHSQRIQNSDNNINSQIQLVDSPDKDLKFKSIELQKKKKQRVIII